MNAKREALLRKANPKPPANMVHLRVKPGQTCFYKKQYVGGEVFFGPDTLLRNAKGASDTVEKYTPPAPKEETPPEEAGLGAGGNS